MKKEPQKIKLTESPSAKDVQKIPLPPLVPIEYDKTSDVFVKPDSDCIYIPIHNENSEQNNS